MKKYTWFVAFEGHQSSKAVRAMCEDEAKVLAQAACIKEGLEWRRIKSVERADSALGCVHVSPLW